MEPVSLTLSGLMVAQRLDRALRDRYPQWGRKAIGQAIYVGHVWVNGRQVWLSSWEVRNGDRVEVRQPPPPKATPATDEGPLHFNPDWLMADDGDLIAVNKPSGLLSEPTRWGQGANLRDLAQAHLGDVILFHRLDRDTSGVLLLTRPGKVNRWLAQAFQKRTVHKEYVAVVRAPCALQGEGTLRTLLAPDPARMDRMVVVERGGQDAATHFRVGRVLATAEGQVQQIHLWPETGRTHQLRVQLAHAGAPILGDVLYGEPTSAPRLMLHACHIRVPERLESAGLPAAPARTFAAPLPDLFPGRETG